MGIRPARTFRDANKVAWSRFSRRTPRKSFVKSMPHNALSMYSMGNAKQAYDVEFELQAERRIMIRDNSLEAARQAINKVLEVQAPNNYLFRVLVSPHHVIRENKMIAGAGADRLQSGMAHPYGRPTERGAILKADQPIFRVSVKSADVGKAIRGFKLANNKLGGKFKVVKTSVKAAS